MNVSHIEGLLAAPFTPMHEDGSLNPGLIPSYYQMLKRNKIKGAFICGSTGEGVSLTFDEKVIVTEAWTACTSQDKDFSIILFLGGTSIKECIDLARAGQKAGINAVASTAPFYFKPNQVSTLAECCLEIAHAIPSLPYYYYHIPVLTGVHFPMLDLLIEVDGKASNFAGIKYTHEDFMDYASCLQFGNGKYDLLWGRDENWLAALAMGAKGAVGSTYNYAPSIYHQITACFNEGNIAEARKLQQKAIEMIRLLGKYGGIATGKSFMKWIGIDCGPFRLPVKNMDDAARLRFEQDVRDLHMDNYFSKN